MKYNDDENLVLKKTRRFFMETPLASVLLKILELFTVSMGFSFILTFIIGSVLAKIIHYRPTEVTYVTLFLSLVGFFGLGAIFLNGFRKFCHSAGEYLLIMLSAYSVYFITSYLGLGFKNLPLSEGFLNSLPKWLYHGWNNQAFENVFLPLRIFAYYQWLYDWASLLVVHIMYIAMIVFMAYKRDELAESVQLFISRMGMNKEVSPMSAKARARYQRRQRRVIRANKGSLEDADVDYDSNEFSNYLKDAFGEVNDENYPTADSSDDLEPGYNEQYDEYMKDAFEINFDEMAPYEKIEYDIYSNEYDEYMKDSFEVI